MNAVSSGVADAKKVIDRLRSVLTVTDRRPTCFWTNVTVEQSAVRLYVARYRKGVCHVYRIYHRKSLCVDDKGNRIPLPCVRIQASYGQRHT